MIIFHPELWKDVYYSPDSGASGENSVQSPNSEMVKNEVTVESILTEFDDYHAQWINNRDPAQFPIVNMNIIDKMMKHLSIKDVHTVYKEMMRRCGC